MMANGGVLLIFLFALTLISTLQLTLAEEIKDLEDSGTRKQKLISTFQIVRFPNSQCSGSNSRNGTCYTSAECSDKSGTSSGSCADGFGVCCTFFFNECDKTSNENNTYWETTAAGVASGQCSLDICPMDTDIVQMRLDFNTFVVTGPSTQTLTSTRRRFGQPTRAMQDIIGGVNGAKLGSNQATNCLLDQFAVSGPSGSSNPPTICGTNTGTHMYVEADATMCNKLTFFFSEAAIATATNWRGLASLANRQWNIRVSQFSYGFENLAPVGCTQYLYGPLTGTINSYNFIAGGTTTHLAQQHQRICIRRERSQCWGCFNAAAGNDGFSVSGPSNRAVNWTAINGCCGYASELGMDSAIATDFDDDGSSDADDGTHGFDCIIIPGAMTVATDGNGTPGNAGVPAAITAANLQSTARILLNYGAPPQICGQGQGIGIGAVANLIQAAGGAITAANAGAGTGRFTICTQKAPFTVEFLSDDIEGQGAVNEQALGVATNRGFAIGYEQFACA